MGEVGRQVLSGGGLTRSLCVYTCVWVVESSHHLVEEARVDSLGPALWDLEEVRRGRAHLKTATIRS